jgi:hypothetical protein
MAPTTPLDHVASLSSLRSTLKFLRQNLKATQLPLRHRRTRTVNVGCGSGKTGAAILLGYITMSQRSIGRELPVVAAHVSRREEAAPNGTIRPKNSATTWSRVPCAARPRDLSSADASSRERHLIWRIWYAMMVHSYIHPPRGTVSISS